MAHSLSARSTSRWRLALLTPVAALAWTVAGLPAAAAMAAPAAPASHDTGATGHGNGNGGSGNGNGNGNAKHDPSAAAGGSGASAGSSGGSAAGSSGGGAADSHGSGGTAGTSGDPTKPQPVSNADQNSGGANGQCPGGPYCSTRDGSPSGNGNGTGKATGKPCAGCVGKADNKNPKGQMPNGSDHNNGYECDGNHGIGRSNPAHTGCTSTPPPPTCEELHNCPPPPTCEELHNCPPPPTCEELHNCPPPVCEPPSTVVDGVCTPPPPPVCEPPNQVVDGVCTPPESCPPGTVLSNGSCQPTPDCVPTAENSNCQPTPPTVCPTGEQLVDGTCVLGEKHTRKPPTQVLGEKVVKPSVLPFTGIDLSAFVLSAALTLSAGLGLVVAGRRRTRRG